MNERDNNLNEINKALGVNDEEIFTEEKTKEEELNDKLEDLKTNNETSTEEGIELTEEEKKELYIKQLKESKWRFFPKKHYGREYKKKRKLKNRLTRKSRKANRK